MSAISDKTKKTYESCLRSVLVDKKTHLVRFVMPDLHEKIDDVIAHIKEAHPPPNSQRVYLSAVMWKVQDDPSAWLKYKEYFDKLRVSADAQASSQTISDAKSENYVPWETIEKAMETAYNDWINNTLSPEEYLMMALYTLIPPVRNDYSDMYVCYGFESDIEKRNYLVIGDITTLKGIINVLDKPLTPALPMKFVFGDYKTFKRYGVKEIPIKSDLLKCAIILWLKDVNSKSKKYTSNFHELFAWNKDGFAKKLQGLFLRYTGKPVGIDLLRRAYITKFINDENPSIARKKEIAEQMLHSYTVQEIYRIVDDSDSD